VLEEVELDEDVVCDVEDDDELELLLELEVDSVVAELEDVVIEVVCIKITSESEVALLGIFVGLKSTSC